MLGKSWLTTVVGVLGAIVSLTTAYLSKGVITAEDLTQALSLIALGGVAKTFNVAGGK